MPTPQEDRAIGAAWQAWNAAERPRVECGELQRARIVVASPEDLQGLCDAPQPVNGCTFGMNPTVFDAPIAIILIRADFSAELQASLVIHESLHNLRACSVVEYRADAVAYTEHINHGETADCQIHYPADLSHCDTELWHDIEGDAFERWQQ